MNPKSFRLLLVPGVAALALTACITGNEPAPEKAELAVAAITTYTTTITFEDPEALAGIPGIAANEHPYVFHPYRYKQRVEPSGNSRLHMYVSEGLLPFPVQNDSNAFEIVWDKMCQTIDWKMGYKVAGGLCHEMTNGRPRWQKAVDGQEWLAGYVSGPGGIRAFNLLGIQVRGTISILLAYKTSAGAWKNMTLAPGTHNLAGLTNIKEFQIRSSTNIREHLYSVDNIRIQYTP